jgi:hypothetical protein
MPDIETLIRARRPNNVEAEPGRQPGINSVITRSRSSGKFE